jgi:serine O-acetyltransferase
MGSDGTMGFDAQDRPEDVPLRELLREDLRTHGSVTRAGFHALAVHRIGRRTAGATSPLARAVHLLARLAHIAVRNVYGIEVAFSVEVGRRVELAHQSGIVINDRCRVGNDCLIRHGVTLGSRSPERSLEVPELRDGVQVGPNAVIMGGIVVGEGARIGPSALVIDDVPPGAVVLAPVAAVRT